MKTKKTSLEEKIDARLSLSFRKNHLLQAALYHPSSRSESDRALENFDRLEFFGDAILNFVICRRLFKAFPVGDEGMLSRVRSILVSRKILARIARDLGFWKLIRLGKSLRNQENISKEKILTDAFEAFLGALYLDAGLAKTERFILHHFEPYFNLRRLFRLDPNPKSMLQELCQKKWRKLPLYSALEDVKGIKATVVAHGRLKASAYGRSRRDAEEKAARALVRKLRQVFLAEAKKVSSGRKLRKIF